MLEIRKHSRVIKHARENAVDKAKSVVGGRLRSSNMIARVEEDDNFCTEFRSKGSKTVNKKHVISNVELGKQNNCVSIDINDVNIDQ